MSNGGQAPAVFGGGAQAPSLPPHLKKELERIAETAKRMGFAEAEKEILENERKEAAAWADTSGTKRAGGKPCEPGKNGKAGEERNGENPRGKAGVAPLQSKPNRVENQFMIDLMILRNSLAKRMESCRERMKQADRYGWRDLRLLYTLVDKVQHRMLSTMPPSRDEYYANLARFGTYHLEIDGPVRKGRYVLIKDTHLAAIAEGAMEHECAMCMREGKEIEKCMIRKALMEVCPPSAYADELKSAWDCEYRDAAGALVLGEEVTI